MHGPGGRGSLLSTPLGVSIVYLRKPSNISLSKRFMKYLSLSEFFVFDAVLLFNIKNSLTPKGVFFLIR